MKELALLDTLNSVFELACLIPNFFALRSLWVATHDEAISLSATVWWAIYMAWVTFYLWMLNQPISATANLIMTGMYVAMVWLLITRRKGK